MTADFVTVLTHKTIPMAKTWQPDGTITPYGQARYFKASRSVVDGIHDLSALLHKLQGQSKACVIRGKYKGEKYSAVHEPDHVKGLVLRRAHLFEDTPHHWALIEVDDFVPLSADSVTEPVAAIEEYLACELPAFANASYHWQLSNSAGSLKNKDTLKAHLWFWLDTAYDSARLKAWIKAFSIKADPAVCNPVQAHYTASPIFVEGVADPVPVRQGFVSKAADSVALVIPDELPTADVSPSRLEVLAASHQVDPVAQRLYDLGMVHRVGTKGELFITCPREHHHTSDGAETTTAYFPANTGGYAKGHFHCLHAHCMDEPDQSFLDEIGFSAVEDFEDLGPAEVVAEQEHPEAPRFQFQHASQFAITRTIQYTVKGVLPQTGLGVIYGDSTAGKTFFVLDLMMAIALDFEDWRGHRVHGGKVAYLCAEGGSGFGGRLRAYAQHHEVSLDDSQFYILDDVPNFLEAKEIRALLPRVKELGDDLKVIVVDTAAQAMPGGNENSSEDMGLAIVHCRLLSRFTGALVILIHHSGKDASRGARGWSGLRHAADVEIEVIASDNVRSATITKLKDGKRASEEFGFELVDVVLGVDDDLDPITSAVVRPLNVVVGAAKRKQKMGKVERLIEDTIRDLALGSDGWVSIDDVVEAVQHSEAGAGKRSDSLKRAAKSMLSGGLLEEKNGSWRLPDWQEMSAENVQE